MADRADSPPIVATEMLYAIIGDVAPRPEPRTGSFPAVVDLDRRGHVGLGVAFV